MFVFGGRLKSTEGHCASIEFLAIRFIGFDILARAWVQMQETLTTPMYNPFVCALTQSSFLVYGGEKEANFRYGKIVDWSSRKLQQFAIDGHMTSSRAQSHGFMTSHGMPVGLVWGQF